MELHARHPVQWFMYMFHFKELQLKHLVLLLDGTTSTFAGNIGKALAKCHELSIVKFDARQNNLPNVLEDVADNNKSNPSLLYCEHTAVYRTCNDYVLLVYAPVWFYIKLEPQCYMGSKHLWRLIQLSRFLHEIYRVAVHKCIQRNVYFGHPENVG